MAFIVLDNSPELGCIQWADLHISYKGTTYEVADGYTDNRYVWWDYSDPYHLQATNDLPALTDDDVLVFFNKNGTHLTVPNTTVVDGGLIVSESILADALAANCVTSVKILAGAISAEKIAASAIGAEKIAAGAVVSEKIAAGAVTASHISANGISANSITSGELLTALVKITGPAGYLRIDGDELVCYNQQGGAMGRFGYYEAFGDQLATFTRASTAYKQDGTQVAAGVPRFEAVGEQRGLLVEEGTTNLLTANQASVETDLSGLNDWTTTGQHTFTRDTTRAWHGNACAKVVSNYAGTQTVTIGTGNQYTPVTPSKVYTAIIHSSGTPGRTFGIGIQWYDASRVFISQAVSSTVPSSDSWTKISLTQTSPANAAYAVIYNILRDAQQNDVLCFDGAQLEQKPYATSWQMPGTSRVSEVLTVPTSGVIAGEKGTVEFKVHVPVLNSNQCYVFDCNSGDNNNRIAIYGSMTSLRALVGNGSTYIQTDLLNLQSGTNYIGLSWGPSGIRFRVNGQSATSTTISRGPATLGVNMYLGSSVYSSLHALSATYSDLRCTSYDKTDEEMAAAYASGLPLTPDDATTLLMSCDGHLQPTVREFGLWSKNGRFVLQDPKAGQGIEVWQNDVLKVLIGLLSTGKIGMKVNGGEIYSSIVRTGAENSTTYVGIESPNKFVIYYYGNKVLETLANSNQGHLKFFEDGVQRGLIYAGGQSNPTFYISAEDGSMSKKRLRLQGNLVEVVGDNGVNINPGNGYVDAQGDLGVLGDLSCTGSKPAQQVTDNYGIRYLYATEAPEVVYYDRGAINLVNGEVTVHLDPIYLECIEPDAELTPWQIWVQAYSENDVYVSEVGDNYFKIKERNGGTSGNKVIWKHEAIRKGYAGIRLMEVTTK